jgi:hypothetical protein
VGTFVVDLQDYDPQHPEWVRYHRLAHDDDIANYLNGDNFVDRAVILVTDPGHSHAVSGLHYVLLVEVDVVIPAGKPKDWSHAQLDGFHVEDPALGNRYQYTQAEMEALVTLTDGLGNKLLKHSCTGLYVGEKSLGRYEKGVRTPAEIAGIDWMGRARYYAENFSRHRLKRIMPAIMLLLDEE